jgi:hypothetical protein
MNLKHIFLLGHRQRHGKNVCCDLIADILTDTNITYSHAFFAELLKKQVAERYGLDASKMELDEYKKWCPPWINPKIVNHLYRAIEDQIGLNEIWELNKGDTIYLDDRDCEVIENDTYCGILSVSIKRTVRDILIEEGCKAREIWGDTWANSAYQKIFKSGSEIGIVSDYRFPNEYKCFENSFKRYIEDEHGTDTIIVQKPQVHRVLIHRPAGVFKNDGADGELPDLEDENAWDYVIMNNVEGNGWKDHLREQILEMLLDLGIIQ